MLKIDYHNKFKKDFKLIKKRGYNLNKLYEVVKLLVNEQPLPKQYLDHSLNGECDGCRECHIQPDWLLIYEIKDKELTLILTRTGTHSDLF